MELVLWLSAGAILGFLMGWGIFSGRVSRVAAEKHMLSSALEDAERARTEFHERAIKAEAALQLQEKQREQQRHEFRSTASTLFEEFSQKFTQQSEKKIGDLLHPMRERLVEFQKMIGDSFSAQGKEQHTLKNEIEKIAKMNDSLTRALRGDVKAQGNWGEVMLERILEESGLRRGEDYTVQATDMGLAGDAGNRLRPDVIINLPENKHIIVDSKVSLTAYERFCAATDAALQETYRKEFLRSIKAHVTGLEQKRYQDIEKLGSPDFVFMFMPIEGAYSLAMQSDPELHAYAWGKKIVIVPPSNLFANLKTIASLWRMERQNQNAQEIARQGGALYDKFVGFIEDLQDVGKQMSRAQTAYDQALGKLSTGSGNLVGRAEKLKQLGAKTAKSLPKEMIEETDNKVVMLTQEP